ncbi:excinuclease ABC subunit UvrA [Brachybacterium halotolerans subsp. kimchii]|uniref:excinuclease ABC subunit UvrA n=1 Tax=Brachybacterium halotolerans TaxID=2795215 RepID=UPI001E5F004C|nr:excinuclease ABC subunit UvrA [Brachybacterium halotolerans]UEJ82053.1 excinuclease ABC subunit UvrA [Brachybacterium halotolerans subsp. kimchii]
MSPHRIPRPSNIEVRGARVHNLRDVDVDVPLDSLVAIAGVSGSGKSSLALGVLYAEGSRRYVEALSTYTRRRMSQAPRAAVDSVTHVPAALALRQRPAVPGVRSTFGTSTELLNVLRLMFSRLASHLCPNGHRVPPTIDVAAEIPFSCPVCGAEVHAPGAESLAFNSEGACPRCEGIGTVREVDDAALVPDPSKSLDEGAVAPWQMFGFNVQPDIAREFGVRTDVPFRDLTEAEREIVLDGPEEKKHITVTSKKGVHDLDFTFRNARLTVTEELRRADSEKRLARVSRFLVETVCPDCRGTRLSPAARAPRIGDLGLAEATALTLDDLLAWVPTVPGTLPSDMQPMARELVTQLTGMADRLVQLGLGYLSLDRAGSSLSTGERQRVQLARAVRNRTTGVLYVLDEPSIGLHPSNIDGLLALIGDLLADGNSVLLVDHDVQVLREADHLIEIGPGSGREGGRIAASGSIAQVIGSGDSRLGPFLDGSADVVVRDQASPAEVFARGVIGMTTSALHTVHPLTVRVPLGRLTAVTGVSGSGKTTMVLESLVPALRAATARGSDGEPADGEPAASSDGSSRPVLPAHVRTLDAAGIRRVHQIDATPIGVNIRSTVATYSGVLDDLRRAFARTPEAKEAGLGAGDFSYNTGSLRCPRCEGTGRVVLDVQFLPDVDIDCPECEGTRYSPAAQALPRRGVTLPRLMALTIQEAIEEVGDIPAVRRRLQALVDLGLGYLTLGEDTPALSGGEAQRLKLSAHIDRGQTDALFVFDEPSVGLHPLDVRTLLRVLDRLVGSGATVMVIEHDLDMIANADHVIDMGPGGGASGGRIVATGTPHELAEDPDSATGRFLRAHLAHPTEGSDAER